MTTQTTDIGAGFALHIGEEFLCCRIQATGEHKVLPNQHAMLVGQLIKILILIITTAPDAQHIHAGRRDSSEFRIKPRFAYPGRKGIGRNIVGAFAKHRHAIHFQVKTDPVGVRFVDDFNLADPNRQRLDVDRLSRWCRRCCRASAQRQFKRI